MFRFQAPNRGSSFLRGGSSPTNSGISRGTRILGLALAFVTGMAVMQTMMYASQAASHGRKSTTLSLYQHEIRPVLRNPSDHHYGKCRFFMAESAVAPNSGLGMFVGTGLLKGDMVGFPDICLFVTAPPNHWTHLHSHTWGRGMYFGQDEGRGTRIACEGYGTVFNTMPRSHINVRIQSAIQQTHSGSTRSLPGAGSISHHFGVHGVATDTIPPGSELTIDYYDWDLDENDFKGIRRPQRTLPDLEQNGWCIDHIEVRPSTIAGAGRGAFVKRPMAQGSVIVPAPLQVFADRADFQTSQPEQLYVNYCLQPENSKMLFFPYGPGVNLINHNHQSPNVGLRWSTKPMHHGELLRMNYTAFWEKVWPGSLILEFVALRDLSPGEELFLDYGEGWDAAWKAHVESWKAPLDAQDYVYPQDMDETAPLRTVEEQEKDPNPPNLITMCNTQDYDREEGHFHREWEESGEEEWWWNMAYVFVSTGLEVEVRGILVRTIHMSHKRLLLFVL